MKMIVILLFLSILLSWHTKFEKRKALNREVNEELMLVPWHPNSGGINACQEMRKNK